MNDDDPVTNNEIRQPKSLLQMTMEQNLDLLLREKGQLPISLQRRLEEMKKMVLKNNN